jgi:hypothetical protein
VTVALNFISGRTGLSRRLSGDTEENIKLAVEILGFHRQEYEDVCLLGCFPM